MSPGLHQSLNDLADPLPITPVSSAFDVAVRPPGSKSLTNRALLLAALADGQSILRGALTDADDAQVMIRALRTLGASVELQDSTVRVRGVSGRWRVSPSSPSRIDLHNAGTATRFLAAAALLSPAGASIIIDGDARMRERPIAELVDALRGLTRVLGGRVDYAGRDGFPPVSISGLAMSTDVATSPVVRFGRTQSSQFISALLLIAPLLPRGLIIEFDDAITSEPYIDMTIGLMRRIGLMVEDQRPRSIRVDAKTLRSFELAIEPDASGATYFEAAAALVPGARVAISGLDLGPRGTLQGDTHFVRVLAAFGATVERIGGLGEASLRVTGPRQLSPVDVNLSDMPDTAMTAAVLCCFAGPTEDHPTATSVLRGLRTLRVKETDRLEALRTELRKTGARVEIVPDAGDESLRITPRPQGSPMPDRVEFETYHDHRMAMSLALIGLRERGVWIKNPGCVAKTYPGYWSDFATLATTS